MSSPLRTVLDTNVLPSALVFTDGRLAELRRCWQGLRCVPLVSTTSVAELIRVLAYPKFKLGEEGQHELLADYLPWCVTVQVSDPPPVIPRCRDPFDAPFLQLALAGMAAFLVSGDRDLLSLGDGFGCPIVTVEEFLKIVDLPIKRQS